MESSLDYIADYNRAARPDLCVSDKYGSFQIKTIFNYKDAYFSTYFGNTFHLRGSYESKFTRESCTKKKNHET